MSLSKNQYEDIMNGYDRRRRENHYLEQQRKDEIYQVIPQIRAIDEEIAHISLETARYMIFHPGEDKKEELHTRITDLSMEKIDLLVRNGYPADYLDPIYSCRLCKDTGYIGSKKCSCFAHYAGDILFEQSNLKTVLEKDCFASFREDYYQTEPYMDYSLTPRENIRLVLATCQRFLHDFDRFVGANLLIYGNAGVGKTFLSHCIAGELLNRSKSVIYLTAYQFFKKLEDNTFRRKNDAPDILPGLLECDLLIIDDLGTEMNNTFINSQLFLCINERILKQKSTIINTNLSLEQISCTYSERIFSRIVESYTLLHIYGDDIRIKKAVSAYPPQSTKEVTYEAR